ncbi:MAG: hypothetical protein JWP97_3601 [Labilithrix sp.]|nr:hypothetical protein [Labilithrix sp.]
MSRVWSPSVADRLALAAAIGLCGLVTPGVAAGEGAARTPPRAGSPARTTANAATRKGPALTATPGARAWHGVAPGKAAPLDKDGRPLLVLQGLNIPDHVELAPRGDQGGFSAEDLDRAAHVMRDHAGNEHPVEPRLLDAVYRLQTHFKAPEIRIVSGYRTPTRPGNVSNHGKGRAMDLVVPGASDEEVAKLARESGFAGVGVYPVSGFVHVDVRERSYFWVDSSGPGKRSRIRGILSDLAARADATALARGLHPVSPFLVGTDVDAACRPAPSPVTVTVDEEDDGDLPMAP